MNLKQADEKFLGQGPDPVDVEVARTEGASIVDPRGRRFLDFLSSSCVGNFGWGVEHLRAAIRKYRGPDYVSPRYRYAPWVELARLLVAIAPGHMQTAYRATGGTEAVDIALQIAMACTGRRGFIAIKGDYHGNSIGAVSVGDEKTRKPYTNLLRGCVALAPPLDRAALLRAERLLKRREVAAVIMEPVVTNLAVETPQPEFMAGLGQLCRRYGTLLIVDEVASGFGRTGKLFASEHYEIEPDIVCLAKALTGGYAPMGATLTTAQVARGASKSSFYSTYGWHPLATAVALANLRWIGRKRGALLRGVNDASAYFRQRLAAMPFKSVRIKGLAIAMETRGKSAAERIAERCRKGGLLIDPEDKDLTMFPPLTVSHSAAKRGLDILEQALG